MKLETEMHKHTMPTFKPFELDLKGKFHGVFVKIYHRTKKLDLTGLIEFDRVVKEAI